MNKEMPPLGDLIGEGSWRLVFQHAERHEWVVKIPIDIEKRGRTGIHNNLDEIAVWNLVKNKVGYRKWFCPIIDYCSAGRWIIMVKAEVLKYREKPMWRANQPGWLIADTGTYKNWGKINEEYFVIDYADPKMLNQVRRSIAGEEIENAYIGKTEALR